MPISASHLHQKNGPLCELWCQTHKPDIVIITQLFVLETAHKVAEVQLLVALDILKSHALYRKNE